MMLTLITLLFLLISLVSAQNNCTVYTSPNSCTQEPICNWNSTENACTAKVDTQGSGMDPMLRFAIIYVSVFIGAIVIAYSFRVCQICFIFSMCCYKKEKTKGEHTELP